MNLKFYEDLRVLIFWCYFTWNISRKEVLVLLSNNSLYRNLVDSVIEVKYGLS